MGAWGLIQLVVDIFLALGIFILGMRLMRAPKDDPRLSRGLQLLQSKISVLEDLSDRTEVQVKQLSNLLDQKCREVQAKIQLADRHVQLIRSSMEKSLEVAEIFQDKIPHQEIIERQNTIKYVQAARLAHQGYSVDKIAKEVDLPLGELEFIAKVNRDQLMFSEEQLPVWAQEMEESKAEKEPSDLVQNLQKVQFEMDQMEMREGSSHDYSRAFEVPKISTDSLEKLGEEFRRACASVTTPIAEVEEEHGDSGTPYEEDILSMEMDEIELRPSKHAMSVQADATANAKNPAVGKVPVEQKPVIRKVEFPRVKINDNLS